MNLYDENDKDLLFMLLFLSMSDSGADDPETLELLKYLEPSSSEYSNAGFHS